MNESARRVVDCSSSHLVLLDSSDIIAYTINVTQENKRAARECLGLRARLLSRLISATYDEAFGKLGLKGSQFTLLNAVANSNAARPSELAKVLAMDESTLSRNVDRMCARGWLRLEAGHDDRRSHRVFITPQGAGMLKKAYPAWLRAQSEVTKQLGPDGVSALRSVVDKLRS
jgi:DNA-binding MarR family transcriptional regulator